MHLIWFFVSLAITLKFNFGTKYPAQYHPMPPPLFIVQFTALTFDCMTSFISYLHLLFIKITLLHCVYSTPCLASNMLSFLDVVVEVVLFRPKRNAKKISAMYRHGPIFQFSFMLPFPFDLAIVPRRFFYFFYFEWVRPRLKWMKGLNLSFFVFNAPRHPK